MIDVDLPELMCAVRPVAACVRARSVVWLAAGGDGRTGAGAC